MDVLSPKIGEIIGGSERESDYDKLMTRIEENAYPDEGYVVVSGYPQVRYLSSLRLRAWF